MNEQIEIKNAVIESASFDIDRGLSAWLSLDYGGSSQGFGGYLLYAPEGWNAHSNPGNICGHFIYRVLQVANVDDWSKLAGRTIRVKESHNRIVAIGHIVKDDWFDPREEFSKLREITKGTKEL